MDDFELGSKPIFEHTFNNNPGATRNNNQMPSRNSQETFAKNQQPSLSTQPKQEAAPELNRGSSREEEGQATKSNQHQTKSNQHQREISNLSLDQILQEQGFLSNQEDDRSNKAKATVPPLTAAANVTDNKELHKLPNKDTQK